jgi:ABC-type glutathione transport system ATPase component
VSSDPVAPSLENPNLTVSTDASSVATATRPLAVHADDLSLRFPGSRNSSRHQAIDGVSFAIPQGEILALIGESGSGKSALARAVAGLAGTGGPNPIISGGSLSVLGRSVRDISPRRRDRLQLSIGYVPQDAGAALDARLTVGENVAEPIYSRAPNFDQLEAGIAVATVIDAVRLPLTTMNSYPHELSRGQRQRVAIARALILEPSLLVADDPTAGIDVTVRGTILDIISELHKDRSFSALIVSHTVNEVRRFGDRVAVLHRGVIVGIGGVDEVLDAPQHEYVSGLARALNDLKAAEALSGG